MKKSFFFLTMAVALLLASCGAPVEPNQINVNPSPLQVVGNKVNAEITGRFPAKKFSKKAVVVITPVLKFDGREVLGEPVTYVGQKVKENGNTVLYKSGAAYSHSVSFDFVPEMAKSELYLRFDARKGKKTVEIPDLKIADGVVTTAKLAQAQDVPSQVTADKFQRVIQEMQEADIMFLIQQANLRSSETGSQKMKDLRAAIKDANDDSRKEIHSLEVSGYASPEGGVDLNTRLAKERQANAQRFLQNQMKQDKVKAEILANMTAEDWEGFRKATENSELKDKALILRVLSMYSDPTVREREIKNISEAYTELKSDILPKLRRSEIKAICQSAEKTEDEIVKLAGTNPDELTQEEALYGSTSKLADLDTKINVLENYVSRFPEDW